MVGLRARWMLGVSMLGVVAALVVALLVGSSTRADSDLPLGGVPTGSFEAPAAHAVAEVPAMRTANSRTYRRADGSFRAVISAAPVNFRNATGAWQPIDTDLKPDGAGGLTTTAAATDVTVPASLDDPAKVAAGGRWLSFALQGADPVAPAVSGATATYSDALTGVDAAYTAQPSGVKETLTLADAGAPSTYRFALEASAGLTPSVRADGAVVVRDAAGAQRFWLPAPTVKQAGDDTPGTGHVRYELAADGRSLSVVVDPAWLENARFPVEVDPTVYTGAWDSCTLASDSLATTSDCNNEWLKVGHDADRTYRSAIRFNNLDIAVPQIASVISAELALTFPAQTTTDAITQVDVAGLDKQLEDGATWETYDGTHAWSTDGGDAVTDPQPNPNWMVQNYIPDWVSFDVGRLAEGWIRDPSSNNGVLLRAHDEDADNVLSFGGQTYVNGGPTLVVTYELSPGLRADQHYTDVGIDDHNDIKVNVTSGNLAVEAHDVHLAGVGGLDLDVDRVFNGQNLGDRTGVFGSAWTESINGAAFVNGRIWYDDARTIYANGGSIYRFDRDYANDAGPTLAYLTPPGIDAQLTVDNDTGIGTLTYGDGRVWTYAASSDGSKFTLQRIDDGDGHHIDLTPDAGNPHELASILDTNGDTLTFTHGLDGQLTQITDADGDHWDYTVDTTDANNTLTSVEDPDHHITTYHYADDTPGVWDKLTQITDADGHDIDLEYGSDGDYSQITKITKHIDSNPDHDQVWHFDYTPDTGIGHACDTTVGGQATVGRTVATDPAGNYATYCYNNTGQVIQTWAPPANTGEPTVTGLAKQGETLVADPGDWDGTPEPALSYQWRRCDAQGGECADIDGADDAEYTATSADVAKRLRIAVTAANAAGSRTEMSALTARVARIDTPGSVVAPTVTGTVELGETLTASAGEWTGEEPITYAYQWLRCGADGDRCDEIAGATAAEHVLGAADIDHALRAEVRAENAGGANTATSAATGVLNVIPESAAVPAISGEARDGQRLTATQGTWTASRPLTATFAWQRCDDTGAGCADIDDATADTYDVTSDDIGHVLRVVVTATNGFGNAAATSAGTDEVAPAGPANVTTPRVGGATRPGGTLHAGLGRWSGTDLDYDIVWQQCDAHGQACAPISGETGDTLDLTTGLTGATVRIVVTATNAYGTATATSPASGVIRDFGADIAGVAGTGETLEAIPDDLPGAYEFSYQWQRCSATGGDCVDIAGGTGHRLSLGDDDLGATVRVHVTASDGTTSLSVVSAVTDPITVGLPNNIDPPVVAGRTLVGSTVTAGLGRWAPDGTPSYDWLRCAADGSGCAAIAGEYGAELLLTTADVDHRLKVIVTETSAAGATSMPSELSDVVGEPALVNTDVPLVTREAGPDGDVLVATPGEWDAVDTVAFAYSWQSCDTALERCVTRQYGASEQYALRREDIGRRLRVVVTARSGGELAQAGSAAGAQIETTPTAAGEAGTIAGTAAVGELLTLEGQTWHGVGPLALAYQWQRCDIAGDDCVAIDGADDASYLPAEADVDVTLRLAVVASGPEGTATATTDPTDVVVAAVDRPAAPANDTPPETAGTLMSGETLTVNPGTWTASGPLTYTYQWQRCDDIGDGCVDVPGATGASYTLSDADVEHAVAVTVTATDLAGTGVATATTPATVRAIDGPQNDEAPVVSGSAIEGATLSTTAGTWSADGDVTFTTRWQRCDGLLGCEVIDAEEADTYELSGEDVDGVVRSVVTATDGDGRRTTVASASTDVVAPTTPLNRELPTVSGDLERGETLHASDGVWDGEVPIAFAYQWQRCDADGESCDDIAGATGDDHVLGIDDVGATIRVVVSAANAVDTIATPSDATAQVSDAMGPQNTSAPAIDGELRENETVTADPGDWTGTGIITYTYRWLLCNPDGTACAPIVEASGTTLELTGDTAYGALRLEVTAHDDDGQRTVTGDLAGPVEPATATDAEIANVERPAIGGEPRVGLVTTAIPGSWQSDASLTYTYRWWRCDAHGESCDRIPAGDASSYTPRSDDLGHRLRVMVTAAAGSTRTVTIMSPPSAAVGEGAPDLQSAPNVSGDAVDGADLFLDTGLWTGDDTTIASQWERCDDDGEGCANITDATGDRYQLTPADIGHRVRALVAATNDLGTATAITEPTDVIAAAPPSAPDLPAITGLARQEGVLTAVAGAWDGTPPLAFAYAWQRCDADGEACAPISGAESVSYTLTAQDLGTRLRVVVTATNDVGEDTSTSDATDIVAAPAAPALDTGSEPEIAGDAHDGQQLTVKPGAWVAAAPLTFTYQWQRCDTSGASCADVTSATAATYTLASGDLGSTLRAVVTAHNPTGTTAATSAATATVATGAPVALDLPTVGGDLRPGATVTADAGRWGGTLPNTYTYAWQRCDAAGDDCADIAGASGTTYTLGDDDARQSVGVRVTAENAHGTVTATSPAAVVGGLRPSNIEIPAIDGAPRVLEVVTASPGVWLNEPDEYHYEWRACDGDGEHCAAVPAADAPDLTPWAALAGKRLRVVVRAINAGDEEPPSATSDASAPVGSASPINVEAPRLPAASPRLYHDFAPASLGEWTGDSLTFTYQWQRCAAGVCTNLAGATGLTYEPGLSDMRKGLVLKVKATAANGASMTVSSNVSAPVVDGGPRNYRGPGVTGYTPDFTVGGVIGVDVGDWSPNTDRYEVRWLRCDEIGANCVSIPDTDVDAREYRARPADQGHTLSVVVDGIGEHGRERLTSMWSAPITAPTKMTWVEGYPSLFGTAVVGETLYAGADSEGGSPEVLRDQRWERCDEDGTACEAIPGATDVEYAVGHADVGSRIRVRVSLTNGWGTLTRLTAPSDVIAAASALSAATPPRIEQPWWNPGPWQVGDSIQPDLGTWQGNPDHVTYQWQRCVQQHSDTGPGGVGCTDIAGANAWIYRATVGDAGMFLRLAVTADAADTSSITTYSNTTSAIEAYLPAQATLTGAAAVDEPLTATTDVVSDDGLTTEIAYRWETLQTTGGGTVRRLVQEGGSTYTPTPDDEGRTLRVTATVTERNQAGLIAAKVTTTAEAAVAPAVTNTVPPAISGDTAAGQTLTVDHGTWTGGGASIAYDYQWRRCAASGDDCVAIDGATDATYATTAADIGHAIAATVKAHSDHSATTTAAPGGGVRHPATAEPVGPITIGEAPVATAAPALNGVAAERETLVADPGAWSGDEPIRYSYQWQACGDDESLCRDIEGATTDSYIMVAGDVQSRLRVRVTATNGSGSATADSPLSDPVAAPGGPPVSERVPRVTLMGAPAPGTTARADEGEWSDATDALIGIGWQRCDADGDACEDIADAFGAAYTLTEEDVDHRVKAVVAASTNGGDAKAISDPTAEISEATDQMSVQEDQLAFVNDDRDELRVGAADGSASRVVVDCEDITGLTGKCELYRPRIAPDLRAIAFEARDGTEDDGVGTIFVVDVDGSGLRRLAHGQGPAWGPSGSTIAFSSGADTASWAMEVDADGSDTTPRRAVLADDSGQVAGFAAQLQASDLTSVESPDVSAGGEVVFMGRTAELDAQIYISESATDQTPRRLDFGRKFSYMANPRFVPDGHAIVFSAQPEGEFEDGVSLWEVDVDGSDLHRVSPKDRKLYGAGVPTEKEVLTTRSDFDICVSPTFARGVARVAAPNGYCKVRGTRGYGMNHDGTNPHFLGLDAGDFDAPVAHAASSGLAEEIRVKEGIAKLEQYANEAVSTPAKSVLRKSILTGAAKTLAKGVAKATVITTIIEFLADEGNPGCDGKVTFMNTAHESFVASGDVLAQIMGASVAPHPIMADRLRKAIDLVQDVARRAKPLVKSGPFKCKKYYVPALDVTEVLLPALQQGAVYLHEIDFQSQRRTAYQTATEIDRHSQPVGVQNCEAAKVIQDAIGRGAGKRNYFVYWAPPAPPPGGVKYIGITRSFDTRCAKHPPERRPNIYTLNLPRLFFQEARSVEEALIAHFGTNGEIANNRFRDTGQLDNKHHSISPDREDYCGRLLVGQFILQRHGYGAYAAAYYTRRVTCPGVGGPL